MAIRISGDDHLWPDGVIPFEIDETDYPQGSTGRTVIQSAISEWNTKTNVTLIQRTFESDYIVFHFGVDENSSDSPIGRSGGAQTVRAATLGFVSAAIVHEIGHAVGLFHEQTREDRDDFIDINWSNVQDDKKDQFDQHADDGDDLGAYDYASIMHYGRSTFARDPKLDTLTPISWFGDETSAAGTAIGDINKNGQPDLVIFHIDNPGGENAGFYRILFDIDQNGNDKGGLSNIKRIPGWFGEETQGGGIALTDIKRNGNLDLIVFWIDNASGGNQGYYKIGWNLNTNGDPASWSDPMKVPGWFGESTQGAGITTAFIKGVDRPDLVVFHIDDPGGANTGYYRIGWMIAGDGTVETWTPPIPIPGWFGNDNQGGGIAAADLDGSGRPSLVVFHIDNPDGDNHGYLRVGRNVDQNGVVTKGWSAPPLQVPGWFGNDNQEGDIALGNLSGTGTNDVVVFHIDNPSGRNHGYFRVGQSLSASGAVGSWSNVVEVHNVGANAITTIGTALVLSPGDISAANTMYPSKSAAGTLNRVGGWFGEQNQGGDVAVGDVTQNGTPDLVVFFIDHPGGGNTGYYRIGNDIDTNGFVTGNYTSAIPVPGWWGEESQGGGVAVANIGHGPALDLVVFHIDHPSGGNAGYYRIGWDLDTAGNVTGGWTNPIQVPGWFGNETQDCAIAVADVNKNGTPDLIVMHVDNPGGANTAYYRIGWDINSMGIAASWTAPIPIPGWFGFETQGAGIAVTDMHADGTLDIVVFHIDNPSGGNRGYYRIGRNVDTAGNVTGGWSRVIPIAGWWGDENQGGGIAAFDINGKGRPDLVAFHIDHPGGGNNGYYRVIFAPMLA